jgi:multimeric flavodoxin WrbA
MPSILSLTGSPVKSSSTDFLLREIGRGIAESLSEPVAADFVRLNDLKYIPCQACGRSPEPDYCIFHDELYPVYEKLVRCDIVLFGSPVYFDSVAGQAKCFIDRCNCLKPPDFEGATGHHFKKRLTKKRLGAIVLVGGERGEFECARKVIAGFFKWVEIRNCGVITYAGTKWTDRGPVQFDENKMLEAYKLGCQIALNFQSEIS